MRTIFILASAALASAAVFSGPALAGEPLHLTPPLYRDQAYAVQQGRPFTQLATTPQPVPAADERRTASSTQRPLIQASAEPRS